MKKKDIINNWNAQAKKHQEKVEAENLAAKNKSEECNLPKLQGSEKQVAWANTVRVKFVETIEKHISHFGKFAGEKEKRELDFVQAKSAKVLAEQTEAKFWIDNRDNIKMVGLPTREERMNLQ